MMIDAEKENVSPRQINGPIPDQNNRVLFYQTGINGLGHLSRVITLATALRRVDPSTQILVLSELPNTRLAHEAQLPCLQIASLATLFKGGPWEGIEAKRRLSLWHALLDATMKTFCPTIVIHDTYIVAPVKKAAHSYEALQVGILRQSWWSEKMRTQSKEDPWRDLDLVLVPHTRDEYPDAAIPGLAPERIIYTGSLIRRTCSELMPSMLRERYGLQDDEFVIVATNGGGNQPTKTPSGQPRPQDNFLQTIIELADLLRTHRPEKLLVHIILITGPLTPQELRLITSKTMDGITLSTYEYEPHLPDLLAAAQAVICRGGYNTMNEVITIGVPTIAIPVMYIFDDQEQRIQWAMTRYPHLQTANLDAADIARRLLTIMEQPWWQFRPVTPEADQPLQGKITAAQLILDTRRLVDKALNNKGQEV